MATRRRARLKVKKETLRALRADLLARVVGGDPGGGGHNNDPLLSGHCIVGDQQGYWSRYCND